MLYLFSPDPRPLGAFREKLMKYEIDANLSLTRRVNEAAVEAPPMPTPASIASKAAPELYGFHPIPAAGKPVTNKLVNALREESGI